jgi:hypothetical protein
MIKVLPKIACGKRQKIVNSMQKSILIENRKGESDE